MPKMGAAAAGGGSHNLLSATHTDSVVAAAVRGAVLRGNATPAWERLILGASGTVPKSDGMDVAYDYPHGTFSGAAAFFMLPDFLRESANYSMATANLVRAMRFFLPFRLTVAKMAFNVMITEAATFAGAGVYTPDGNTRLLSTGAVDVSTLGVKSVTLGTPVTLNVGFYWSAFTCSGITAGFTSLSLVTAAGMDVVNGNTIAQGGDAANAGNAGVLPATLGVVTAQSNCRVPICKLQG